ncbi:MAG: EAL domain-containing protein, partial [Planctomycetota bacterium]|nr:EAL domain-containing protein [Planctomycetota bacterium]
FDIVKIDQCIGSRDRQWRQFVAITKAMVELVHTLDMPVVAEGIETQEQVNMLQKVDCDFGQGWLFSKAVSEQQAGQLLLDNKRWMSAA